MSRSRRLIASFLLVSFLSAVIDLAAWPLYAQGSDPVAGYRVGVGDTIFMAVPQRPDLNRSLVIKPGGVVSLPLIGDVVVAGLTAQEIQAKLLEAIQDFYPSINQVQATVTQAVSQMIWVNGEVRVPGKYAFASPPTVWEAIREAGGPLATSALDHVRIIRDISRGGATSVVNVAQALETGTMASLPTLDAGDTIIIPAREDTYTGIFGVNVFGEVERPGVYRLQARRDLVGAILTAGGPTDVAELGDVTIIRVNKDGSSSTIDINFKKFLKDGDLVSNPQLQAGDTINIPEKSALKRLNLRLVLGVISTALTITALAISLDNR